MPSVLLAVMVVVAKTRLSSRRLLRVRASRVDLAAFGACVREQSGSVRETERWHDRTRAGGNAFAHQCRWVEVRRARDRRLCMLFRSLGLGRGAETVCLRLRWRTRCVSVFVGLPSGFPFWLVPLRPGYLLGSVWLTWVTSPQGHP